MDVFPEDKLPFLSNDSIEELASPRFKTPKRSLFRSVTSYIASPKNTAPSDEDDITENDSFTLTNSSNSKLSFSYCLSNTSQIQSSTLLAHWNHRKPLHMVKPNRTPNINPSPFSIDKHFSVNRSSSPLSLASRKRVISSSSLTSTQSTLLQYFEEHSDHNLQIINEEQISSHYTNTAEMTIEYNTLLDSNNEHQNGERCQLPYVETGKDALKRISPETLVDLLQGKFDDLHDERYLIDCRFPYEYEGGHIQSGININTMNELENLLLKKPVLNRRTIVIFHCEFSSHRAPKMALYLRNQDRMLNYNHYPKLFYPEIYVLKGGYKAFYNEFKTRCIPQHYIPMNHNTFKDDLRREMTFFKKSWKRCKSFSDVPREKNANVDRNEHSLYCINDSLNQSIQSIDSIHRHDDSQKDRIYHTHEHNFSFIR